MIIKVIIDFMTFAFLIVPEFFISYLTFILPHQLITDDYQQYLHEDIEHCENAKPQVNNQGQNLSQQYQTVRFFVRAALAQQIGQYLCSGNEDTICDLRVFLKATGVLNRVLIFGSASGHRAAWVCYSQSSQWW